MRKRQKIWPMIAAIIVFVIIFALAILLFVVYENNIQVERACQNYGKEQMVLVRNVAIQAKERLNAGEATENVIERIVKKQVASGSRYWFLYENNYVLLEDNQLHSDGQGVETVEHHTREWIKNGGENVDHFLKLIEQNQSGVCTFSRGADLGEEIVSVQSFYVQDKSYVLGLATSKQYMIATTKLNVHLLRVFIFGVISVFVLFVIALLFCIHIYKSSLEINQMYEEMKHKNMQIAHLNELAENEIRIMEIASISDGLTHVYNRRFYDAVLSKMNHQDNAIRPLSIVTVDIDGLKLINDRFGYHAGDEALLDLATKLGEHTGDTDIVARTGNSEFTVIMACTTEADAYARIEQLVSDILKKKTLKNCAVSYGVAAKESEEPDVYTLADQSVKNLQLSKLLSPTSFRYQIILFMKNSLFERTNETEEHCERMRELAVLIGKRLRLSIPELKKLETAALLHDLGKIGIPDHILKKRGALDENEREIIKQHAMIGYRIADSIPDLKQIAPIIAAHHERFDGLGYPNRLKGNEILLLSRIITVVDSYDTMTSNRVYSRAKSEDEARSEIFAYSGTYYDPNVAQALFDVLDEAKKDKGVY